MIGLIKGNVIDISQKGLKKYLLICSAGIGYEVQVLERNHISIKNEQEIILWINQVIRENEIILFGFQDKLERNLFRKLIEVNGIGPQIALSLLDKYSFSELITSIKNEDINKLKSTSGIGKRIAERIIVELKDKLNEFDDLLPKEALAKEKQYQISLNSELKKDLIETLKDLNYKESEIKFAIHSLEAKGPMTNHAENKLDTYIKRALVLLSQDLA
tara:strand:- start:30894 stop:31544 length:651 start_codon:yes stop_codon:yes gene_type:complete